MTSKTMKRLLPAVVGVFLVAPTLFAQRQEIVQLSADIINLEQQVREIQRTLNGRNSALQSLIEQTFDRVVLLTDTLDRVVSTVGEIRASNDRLSGELRAEISNLATDVELMDRTLTDVRAEVSAISRQMTSLSATTQELGSPDTLLREAQLDLTIGNYELARAGFQDYLFEYGNSPQASIAQMGLGDSWFDDGDYEQSIVEYDILIERYPTSDRIADALHKKGLALLYSGMEADARDVFNELVTTFPESPQGLRAQEQLNALDN
jgi:TolA-binding protein